MVELRDDLGDLHRLLARLGPHWRAVFSDYRLDAGGNRERVGFLFDTRRVTFTGLASHAEADRIRQGDEYQHVPWWRPPFLASFAAGRLAFVLVAAHIRWGRTVPAREAEVAALAAWAGRRSSEKAFQPHDMVLVGDFNLPSQRSWVWGEFTPSGFLEPPALSDDPGSELARGKRHDRVLWKSRGGDRFTGEAGAL
ncbi:MAG: endonuclease, partial [Myxococcales bacterium]